MSKYNTLFISLSIRGFTVVELMIVTSIIGILAAALFPSVNQYLIRSRDTSRYSDLHNLHLALSTYEIDKEALPSAEVISPGSGGCYPLNSLSGQYIAKTYTSPSGIDYNEGCGINGMYAYGASSGYILTPRMYVLMAITENDHGGNYSGSTSGMTGELTPTAHENIPRNMIKGVSNIYIIQSGGNGSGGSSGGAITSIGGSVIPVVDGGWSPIWSTCSGICGTGTQARSCNNPEPSGGGADCTGSSTQYCTLPACLTYIINWSGSGGTGHSPTLSSITQGDSIGTLPSDPTRADYTFAGWYDSPDATGGNQITITTTPVGNTTYYARWMANPVVSPTPPPVYECNGLIGNPNPDEWGYDNGYPEFNLCNNILLSSLNNIPVSQSLTYNPGARDIYAFVLEQGRAYDIESLGDDYGSNTVFFLYDNTGNRVAMNDNLDGWIYRSKITYTATYTGYYYLGVMGDYDSGTNADYTLNISTNGSCGSDNGGSLTTTPINLCTSGISSSVVDNGGGMPYEWTCNGTNGGTNSSCSANNLNLSNGACGSDNSGNFVSTPNNLCSSGIPGSVIDNGGGNTYTWMCNGFNGGTSISCNANNVSGPVIVYLHDDFGGSGLMESKIPSPISGGTVWFIPDDPSRGWRMTGGRVYNAPNTYGYGELALRNILGLITGQTEFEISSDGNAYLEIRIGNGLNVSDGYYAIGMNAGSKMVVVQNSDGSVSTATTQDGTTTYGYISRSTTYRKAFDMTEIRITGSAGTQLDYLKITSVSPDSPRPPPPPPPPPPTTYPGCNEEDMFIGDYIVASCNVGATIAGTDWTTSNTIGQFFQWGRNKGFVYGTTGYQTTQIAGTSGLNALADSAQFIVNTNWANGSIVDNWGHSTNTLIARQGPCATGYHVPSSLEWSQIDNYFNGWSDGISDELRLPRVGYRSGINGSNLGAGSNAFYWSSTYQYGEPKAMSLFTSSVMSDNSFGVSHGLPVRCFKN